MGAIKPFHFNYFTLLLPEHSGFIFSFFRHDRKIAKSNYEHRYVCLPTWNNLAPTGHIFINSDILSIFLNSVENIQISLKSDKNNRYFTWRPIHIYDYISLSSL